MTINGGRKYLILLLMLLRVLTFLPFWVSTSARYSSNSFGTWLFCFKNLISHHPDRSSMNVQKYLLLPREVVRIGPHTSECTTSPTSVSFPVHWGKGSRCILPLMHVSHSNDSSMFFTFIPRRLPCVTALRRYCTFKWPSFMCQSSSKFFSKCCSRGCT